MATLHCDNITSEKRFLPEGSVLLLGDQILSGKACKEDASQSKSVTDEEAIKDDIARRVYDLPGGSSDMFNVGDCLESGDFVTEGGFVAGAGGVEVIHSGYGGEARAFAPGTKLKVGDLLVNGNALDPDGNQVDAPLAIDKEGFEVGSEGAVVSPGGDDSDEAYCSLQELAAKPEDSSPLDDFASKLELDLNIPGLDMGWWIALQQKINEVMALQAKFIARTQNMIARLEIDPDKACDLVPDVNKLIKLMQRVNKIIAAVAKIMRALAKIVKTVKRVYKLIKFIVKPIKVVEGFLMLLQLIEGIPNMIAATARSLTETSRIIPQLIALLQKVVAQCAANRGAEAGLSKEECEAVGGTYVDRRLGDLGDTTGGSLDDGLDALISGLEDDLEDVDFGFLKANRPLNPGDKVLDGTVVLPDGTEQQAPFTVKDEGTTSGPGGVQTNNEDAMLDGQKLEALLDTQLVDLSECLTAIDDLDRTRTFR